jgi:uncharacterized protein YjdB
MYFLSDSRFKKSRFVLVMILAVIMVFTLSSTLVFADDSKDEDSPPPNTTPEQVAAQINASPYLKATISGKTVTVTTKKESTEAPQIIVDVPEGVTLVWKAKYVNSNFNVASKSGALLTVIGNGNFYIEDGAEISVTAYTEADNAHVYAVAAKSKNIKISGGSITLVTKDPMAAVVLSVNYVSTFKITGGAISLSGKGPLFDHENFYAAILINHGIVPVADISGGTISVSTDRGAVYGIMEMQSKPVDEGDGYATGTINLSGGEIQVINSGTGENDATIGIAANDINVTGGLIYGEGNKVVGIAVMPVTSQGEIVYPGSLLITDKAAIILKGKEVVQYVSDDRATPTIKVSEKYVDEQLKTLVGYNKTITVGESLVLIPKYTPVERVLDKLTWKSSDSSIATVDADGKIVGISDGVVTITATAGDFSGLIATFKITVESDDEGGDSSESGSQSASKFLVVYHFGTWTGSDVVSAKIDAELSSFKELRLNGEVVDSSNYTLTPGSTIITLHDDYLKTLTEGEYTFEAVFETGSATITLTVPALTQDGTAGGDPASSQSTQALSPRTGDGMNLSTWIVLAICALTLMLAAIAVKRKSREVTK